MSEKHTIRFLKFVASAGNDGCGWSRKEGTDRVVLTAGNRQLATTAETLQKAIEKKHVANKSCNGNTGLILTPGGKSLLIRLLHPQDGFREQHLESRLAKRTMQGKMQTVRVTDSESPLARLRHGGGGRSSVVISDPEFEAGECLRRDFEKAGLRPSITSNWSFAGAGSGKGALSPRDNIQDFAMDAKQRFNKAVSSMEPELKGVAVDVCCFLKGLEEVEFERNWPRRSARVMLKASLSALARHYGYLSDRACTSRRCLQLTAAWLPWHMP